MIRELRQVRLDVLGVDRFEHLACPAVQLEPASCRELLIKDIADQRVRKSESADRARDVRNDGGRYGLVQDREQIFGGETCEATQSLDRELAT